MSCFENGYLAVHDHQPAEEMRRKGGHVEGSLHPACLPAMTNRGGEKRVARRSSASDWLDKLSFILRAARSEGQGEANTRCSGADRVAHAHATKRLRSLTPLFLEACWQAQLLANIVANQPCWSFSYVSLI